MKPKSPNDKPEEEGSGKDRAEKDAKGQFVRSRHGADNSGVTSARPRVITGHDDATVDGEPKDDRKRGKPG